MRSLKSKILLITTTIALVSFASCWLIVNNVMEKRMIKDTETRLAQEAFLTSLYLTESDAVIKSNIHKIAKNLKSRISVIDEKGTVISDSEKPASELDNHSQRPEIRSAIMKGTGSEVRYSRSIGTYMVYSAIKTETSDGARIIRLAYRLSDLNETRKDILLKLFFLFFLLLALILSIEHLLINRFFDPLDRIVSTAETISLGKEASFPILRDSELKTLANTLNIMYTKLKKALNDIDEEREDLKVLISSMPVGLILLNKDRQVILSNETACNLIDLDSTSLLPGEIASLVDKAIENEEDQSLEMNLPEKKLHVKTTIKSIKTGIIVVIQDLTEQYRLAESRKNFIADAGHEFQTPLTSIGITTEYLMESSDESSQNYKYLGSILNQQKRLTTLVDDLLYLSRLESQPKRRTYKSYNIIDMLKKILSYHRENPLTDKIEVTTNFPDRAIAVGDPDQMERAITNIIGNAVKYVHRKYKSSTGGKIHISLSERDSSWVLTVDDNGIGIREEVASSIFERFNRGDLSRTRRDYGEGGYGLGLAIAKKILEEQGGFIELSKIKDGATFKLTIEKDSSGRE